MSERARDGWWPGECVRRCRRPCRVCVMNLIGSACGVESNVRASIGHRALTPWTKAIQTKSWNKSACVRRQKKRPGRSSRFLTEAPTPLAPSPARQSPPRRRTATRRSIVCGRAVPRGPGCVVDRPHRSNAAFGSGLARSVLTEPDDLHPRRASRKATLA